MKKSEFIRRDLFSLEKSYFGSHSRHQLYLLQGVLETDPESQWRSTTMAHPHTGRPLPSQFYTSSFRENRTS